MLSSIPPTRASHALYHAKDFGEAIKGIEKAVKNGLVSEKKYNHVGVISLRWENDDLNLGPIEAELLNTFKTVFHYDIESFIIPATSSNNAAMAVSSRMRDFFAKYGDPTSLAIVVYEGHSDYTAHGIGQQLLLYGSSRPAVPVIPWSVIEGMMFTNGDVLAILDSCFTAAPAMTGINTEYLVSSAFKSRASAAIQQSFTRRLIDLLASQIHTEVTIAQIHAKLVQQANQPSSVLDNTPIHILCKDKPSITLRPLRKLPRELADLKKRVELSDGKVLVSILLQEKPTIPSIKDWEAWLVTAIPADVADIKIEAVFESNSTLCLVTMPIAVFDMLNREEAYGFVAYVPSNNLMNTNRFRSEALELLSSCHGNVQLPTRENK